MTVAVRRGADRVAFSLFAVGCAFLFWQHDAAPVDWLFAAAILLWLVGWALGGGFLLVGWPHVLVLVFLAIAVITTVLGGASFRFLALTSYVGLLALGLGSALVGQPARRRVIEAGIVFAALVTSVLVTLGAVWESLGLPPLEVLAQDQLRARGLFKDANVAGAFLACSYPLVAATALRLPAKGAVPFLLLVTGVMGAGVFFSFSRLALILLGFAILGTVAAYAFHGRWMALIGMSLVFMLVGSILASAGGIPVERYRLVQRTEETARFVAWAFAFDLARDKPLGSGSGSFEKRFGERMEREVESERARLVGEAAGGYVENRVRNGAMAGPDGWELPRQATIVADSTSITGYAVRKETTARYQEVSQIVSVIPEQRYSLAAQIRTDGSPAHLIVHWRDDRGAILSQSAAGPVTATEWTEVKILDDAAPLFARSAAVILSNFEAGVQYFTAVRMVPGPEVPAWSPTMQRTPELISIDFARDATAAHNTYLRIAVESGLVGLAVFATYLIGLLAVGLAGWTRDRWQWALALALVTAAGFVIDTLHWRQLWVYAGVLGAIAYRPIALPFTRKAGVARASAPEPLLRSGDPGHLL